MRSIGVALAVIGCMLAAGCQTYPWSSTYRVGVINRSEAPALAVRIDSETVKGAFVAVQPGERMVGAWSFTRLPSAFQLSWKSGDKGYKGTVDIQALMVRPSPGVVYLVIGPDRLVSLEW